MKKIINSVFVLGMLAMAFTSCEDVPAPFNTDFNGGAEQVVVAPAGEGTLESPYNVAKALDIVKKGAQSTAKVYAKGIITKIDGIDTNYGNANYHLADTKGGKPTLQVYRGNYYGGKKFTTGQEINVGDTLLITGVLTIYNGTPQFGQGSQIVTINGKADSNANSDLSTAAPTGDGTAASPYNVAKAQSVLATLEADKPTDSVYIAGTVVGTPEINVQFGNATFLLSDDKSGRLSVYRGKYLQGSRFTATDQLKEGDKVVIFGALVNYKGNTPQVSKDSRMVSHNGKTVAENTGGGTTGSENIGGEGVTGESMTANLIAQGKIGSVELQTGKYGSQDVTKEDTWYTWKFNNITYKGAKIAVSEGNLGEGIQVQGNADDVSKQGFLFNADAFSSEISKVTVVMSVIGTSTFVPGYSFYAGTTAHPVSNAIVTTPVVTENGKYKEYIYEYDLSSGNYKFFTIANNKVGAIYVKNVTVVLK